MMIKLFTLMRIAVEKLPIAAEISFEIWFTFM